MFFETANTPFAVYVLIVQIYLNQPITVIVIENCLMNKFPSSCHIKALNQKYENILVSLHCDAAKMLLDYLNVIFSRQLFEHIFLTLPSTDYNKNYLSV